MGKESVEAVGAIERIQVANDTRYNRYPEVFRAVSVLLSGTGNVLSFGCSTGDEIVSLAQLYFRRSTIVGVDVDADALAQAKLRVLSSSLRDNTVIVDESTNQNLQNHGPFDCVLAMSVLCRWPDTKGMRDISAYFPFSFFEQSLKTLDSVVKPGGFLVVYNANYYFEDASISNGYEVPAGTEGMPLGFVTRFPASGVLARDTVQRGGVVFRKKG